MRREEKRDCTTTFGLDNINPLVTAAAPLNSIILILTL
jgi:hypothetical protein